LATLLASMSVVAVRADVLLDDAFLVSPRYAAAERAFTLPAAGSYQLQLTDLAFPLPLQGAAAAVASGSTRIAALPSFGAVDFTAAAGAHKLLVAPRPQSDATFGTFGATIAASGGGSPVLQYSEAARAVAAPAVSLQASERVDVAIAEPGSYRVSLVDLRFPAALERADVQLSRPDGSAVVRLDLAQPTADVTLDVPGTYKLLASVKATDAAAAGLYGVEVRSLASGGERLAATYAVGRIGEPLLIDLAASSNCALELTDLAVPRPYATLRALATQGVGELARADTPGESPFDAAPGQVRIWVSSTTAGSSDGTGTGYVAVRRGTTLLADALHVASPALDSGSEVAYAVPAEVVAGNHRAELTDFEFPAALAGSQLAVVQSGQVLASRQGPGAVDVMTAAGPLQLVVVAAPSASTRSGLLTTRLLTQPAGEERAASTQAIGITLDSRSLQVTQAVSHDLTLSDLGFPATFAELALAVTRGNTRVATVVGSGKVTFDASPGAYQVNVLARTGPASFGAYGLRVATTPPAPTITLAATPSHLRSGETATLTWSTTGADRCTASDGWSGTRGTSGSESTPALTSDARYTLTCAGAGGSTATTVQVTVRADGSGGGGGGAAGVGLVCLLLCAAATVRARART
jgi:hypothetical protein